MDLGESSNSSSRLVTSGFTVLVAMASNLGLAFLIKLAVARSLGPVGYGHVVIGISVVTLTRTLVVLGIDQGVVRFLPRKADIDWHRSVVFSALQMVVPVTVVAGGAIAIAGNVIATSIFHDAQLGPVIRVFGIALVFDVLTLLVIRITQGLERTIPKVVLEVGRPLIRLVAVGVALLTGYGAVGVAVAFLFSNVIAAIGGFLYLRVRTRLFALTSFSPVREDLFRFSAPLLVTSITLGLFSNVDLFMLGNLVSSGTVGVYSAMYSLATIVSFFLVSFEFLYMPYVSRLDSAGDVHEIRNGYSIVTTWATVTTVPVFVALVVLRNPLIALSFGPSFVAGSTALVIIAGAYVVSALLGPNMKTLLSMGYTRSIMIYNVVGFVCNIAFNLFLIPRYSFLGAAVATLVSYVVMNVFYSVHLYWKVDIVPKPNFAHLHQTIVDTWSRSQR